MAIDEFKFLDFKFVSFFRIILLAFAILSFIFPWTGGRIPWSGPGAGFESEYCSGLDYLIGCEPINGYSLFIQTPYILLNPIILFIALILTFYEKKMFVVASILVGLLSFLPIYIWYLDVSYMAPASYLYLNLGLFFILVATTISTILGLVALCFCEIDASESGHSD